MPVSHRYKHAFSILYIRKIELLAVRLLIIDQILCWHVSQISPVWQHSLQSTFLPFKWPTLQDSHQTSFKPIWPSKQCLHFVLCPSTYPALHELHHNVPPACPFSHAVHSQAAAQACLWDSLLCTICCDWYPVKMKRNAITITNDLTESVIVFSWKKL